ncbi:MAG: hypothetical protein AAF411_26990, partial [Myxococcota bacterium]
RHHANVWDQLGAESLGEAETVAAPRIPLGGNGAGASAAETVQAGPAPRAPADATRVDPGGPSARSALPLTSPSDTPETQSEDPQ